MNTNGLEKKITFSFDRGHSANIFFKKPDKFREIEELSKHNGTLINTGSNLSYSPLSFCKDSVSINLKKFNRIPDCSVYCARFSMGISCYSSANSNKRISG